jgi:hypothetical protein
MATNIFVSHIHEDDPHIEKMKTLLGERGFDVRDSSIDSGNPNRATNPDYIKSKILAPAIEWASVTVVLISPGTRTSDWVDWEIRHAQQSEKRIVGVFTHGAAECDIPEALEDYGAAVVGWQGDRIVSAICGDINDWESSDGIRRPPREITRIVCQTR